MLVWLSLLSFCEYLRTHPCFPNRLFIRSIYLNGAFFIRAFYLLIDSFDYLHLIIGQQGWVKINYLAIFCLFCSFYFSVAMFWVTGAL